MSYTAALRVGQYFVVLIALIGTTAPARAQGLTFNFNWDTATAGGTSNPAYYTDEYRAAITRAATYLGTEFDARGTVTVNMGTGDNLGSSTLAVGGTSFYLTPGSFSNGISFEQATTGSAAPAQSFINFNVNQTSWHTAAESSAGTGLYDLQSVALHELTHGLGFTSLIKSNGSGLQSNEPGTPDTYSRLAYFLRLGTAADSPRIITEAGAFNTPTITSADLTSGNIYFHGEMAVAANGGRPINMASGLAHILGIEKASMYPSISSGIDQRAYAPAELAMLIDMGWNQFVWKDATGDWADNVSSLTNPRWANVEGDSILSPLGTVTPNLVLRFGGSGGYTSTNGLSLSNNRFLVNRVILNATGGTSTIAGSGSNVLRFDTTIGITPLIRQEGAGAFDITHAMELTSHNLELGGAGIGTVTLGGVISGNTGGLIKTGTSTFALAGTAANTFGGNTAVNGGVLLLNKTAGTTAIGGNVAINSGGTLRLGAANQIADTAAVTLSGGKFSTGASTGFDETVGSLTMTSASTIELGSTPHTLAFAGITGTPTGVLTITGWTGDVSKPGTGGRIQFSGLTNPNATYETFLSTVQFQGYGVGGTFLSTGTTGVFELAPVPEPASVVALAGAALGAGAFLRRRWRRAAGVSLSA